MHKLRRNDLQAFEMFPTTIFEVTDVISNLKRGNIPCYDDIINTILKYVCDVMSVPLTHIINLSFYTFIFPTELKIANIVTVYKAGDPKLFSNYSPISVLPSVSKSLKKNLSM